ncbi:MAG: 1-acyl-sn-glycerol-3-phosphate acyltransferase [Bacteroidota bacterium]
MTKPAYLSHFLYGFYHSLKLLVRIVFKLFFSKTTIINPGPLKIDRPTILVSNHPNTLLDPLNVAVRADTIVFFLANASLFKTPMANWFLNGTYVIPIERPQDVGGKMVKNEANFARCDEFLSKGGCLYIAPEGGSKMPRRLQRIKTGTARIMLSAENKNNFELGMQILPVGLIYEDSLAFRKKVLLNVGEPIFAKEFEAIYREDTFKAARQLTAHISEKMEALLVHTRDDEEDQLLHQLEEILENEEALPHEQQFRRTKALLAQMQAMPGEEYEQLARDTRAYFGLLEGGLSDAALVEVDRRRRSRWGQLIVGSPLFLWGWVNNYIPSWIPAWAVRKLKLYIGYTSNVLVLSGLFTYPIFYALQTWLVHSLFGLPWLSALYLLSLVPSGLFAWHYREQFLREKARRKAQQFKRERPQRFEEARQHRRRLLQSLHAMLSKTEGHSLTT